MLTKKVFLEIPRTLTQRVKVWMVIQSILIRSYLSFRDKVFCGLFLFQAAIEHGLQWYLHWKRAGMSTGNNELRVYKFAWVLVSVIFEKQNECLSYNSFNSRTVVVEKILCIYTSNELRRHEENKDYFVCSWSLNTLSSTKVRAWSLRNLSLI